MDSRATGRARCVRPFMFFGAVALWAGLIAAQEPPHLVGEINPSGGAGISSPFAFGGAVYFAANDGQSGAELWKSDGAATAPVKDINPEGDSAPSDFAAAGGILYFAADDGVNGRELWRTDGTEAGTVLVRDVQIEGSSSPSELSAVGGVVYFSADNGVKGRELWKSDGTEAGTVLVKDVNGAGGAFPSELTIFNGMVYFSANEEATGQELWKTDGTDAGTALVTDIWVNGHSSPQYLTVAGGFLFFSAVEPGHGQELWRTDGTAAGTVLVKDIRTTGNSFPMALAAIGNTLYFSADDGATGRELWKSDGTAAGTVRVADIVAGAFGSFPQDMTTVGGGLYFSADDGAHGRELWWSDGTGAGTRLVLDIRSPGTSGPRYLTEANGLLYFQATDNTVGQELWVSNNSGAGTTVLLDINPGVQWSGAANLAQVGNTLFFTADDGVSGAELWAYPLPEIDVTPPVITVIGANPLAIEQGMAYIDPGAAATDNADGDISASMVVNNLVSTATPATYTVTYDVSDSSGNSAHAERTVNVLPSAPPVITLLGEVVIEHEVHTPYQDAGATALDNVDGDISANIVTSNPVNADALGSYTITFSVSDSAGNAAAVVSRTVNVLDSAAPVLTVLGANPVTIEQFTAYVDAGATAQDNVDGDLTGAIVTTNPVSTAIPATYQVAYSIADSSGNEANASRTVHVLPQMPPAITLLGGNPYTTAHGAPFVEPGFTATDNVDGDVTARVVVTGAVNTGALGEYALTYSVSDSAGNAATPVVRAVIVADRTPPLLTLIGGALLQTPQHSQFVDPGATAVDEIDGDLTSAIVVSGAVNTNAAGAYTLSYSVSDAAGNAASATRTVTVAATAIDTTPPVITLLGDAQMIVKMHASFVDPGATAVDAVDGDLTSVIVVNGAVDTSKKGPYTLTYSVSDAAGNAASASRMVVVADGDVVGPHDPPPTLTLSGPSPEVTIAGPVAYQVTYVGAAAITLTAADISLVVLNGDVSGAIEVMAEGNVRTIAVENIAGSGAAGISIAEGTAVNASGDPAAGEGPSLPFVIIADADGDGFPDEQEEAVGTDPNDPEDRPSAWDFLKLFETEGPHLYAPEGLNYLKADVDKDQLPDRYGLALTAHALGERYSPHHGSALARYLLRMQSLRGEAGFKETMEDVRHVLSGALISGLEMRRVWAEALSISETTSIVFAPKSADEPFTGQGDYDGDEVSNYAEYVRVKSRGGELTDFVEAATTAEKIGEPMPATGWFGWLVGAVAVGIGGAWASGRRMDRGEQGGARTTAN